MNELFNDVFRRVFEIRNEYGILNFNALFLVMEAMGLPQEQRLEILEKANVVERVVQQQMKEKSERESANKAKGRANNGPPTPNSKVRL